MGCLPRSVQVCLLNYHHLIFIFSVAADMFYHSDELKSFFSKYGNVLEHWIVRDHETNRSRGFGFVVFDSKEVVNELLSNGNMIDMAGTQVSLLGWLQELSL